MNIVVSINKNYINPLCVMLYSLMKSNENEKIDVYLVHSELEESDFEYIKSRLNGDKINIINTFLEDSFLADAPITFHFSREMYYRIFASNFLPKTVDKALYLDPDMVIVNSLWELYNTNMGENFFAATKSLNPITQTEYKFRLKMPENSVYFNSGVLLMNIKQLREELDEKKVLDYIRENQEILVLPDQDVLNSLYNDRTIVFDDFKFNFDARYYNIQKLIYRELNDLNEIRKIVSIVHFCGKNKPWLATYKSELGKLYTDIALKIGIEAVAKTPKSKQFKLKVKLKKINS
ncbi:MAG: glycosyltransferase family 8 protein [Oscillospiraceae bacterium]